MKTITSIIIVAIFVLTSCNREPSLDKYFVENQTNKSFVSVDVSPAMFNTAKAKFTAEQAAALKSFKKMNVLYFKKTNANTKEFEAERLKIKTVLQNDKYQNLMKFGMGKDIASISYVGSENNISEFIISGNKNDVGLAIIRIQGKDMSPDNVMKIAEAMQSGNFDFEAFKPILEMIKK